MNSNRVRLGGLLVVAFFLSLTGAFLAWHLAFPSDGARLEPGESVWRSNGVIVSVLEEQAGGLRTGDRVIAVEGKDLPAWAQAAFDFNLPRPNWQFDQTVIYTLIREGRRLDVFVRLGPYPLGAILEKNWSTLLFTLISQIIVSTVYVLRPTDRAARALFLWVWSLSHTYTWSLGLQISDIVSGTGFWLYQLSATGAWLIFWSAGLEFALSFPRPQAVLYAHRRLTSVIYLAPFVFSVGYLAVTAVATADWLGWMGAWMTGNFLVAMIFVLLTIAALANGYRAYRDWASRQKMRWMVFAFVLFFGGGLVFWFLPGIVLGQPVINANALGLLLLPFPVILAIAILRYQLFDIDLIIRRTLIYSVLTSLLAIIYFGSVVLLQQLFHALTGQGQNQLVTVVSTLAIAALFLPLRRRVQNTIDRRFYRRKYDAAKTLAEFGKTARDETDLDKLTERLVDVVQETMQPAHVSLWLRKDALLKSRTIAEEAGK